MIIRDIGADDKDAVKAMIFGLYEEDDLDIEMTDEVFECNFRQALKHEDTMRIMVFELDGMIAGYSIILKQWSGETGGWVVQIDELYVNRQFRGRGCGTIFLQWLETKYADVTMFYLETSKNNETARRLYRKMGFKESSLKGMYRNMPGSIKNAS